MKISNEFTNIGELIRAHIGYFTGEDKGELQAELAEAYINTGQYEEAWQVCKELKENGFYNCTDLRKSRKVFGKLPEYQEYMKTCKDKPEN
jgi:pentatricopeptide repeat protein